MENTLPTDAELESLTPMLRQFYDVKRQYPESIVFFRMGDFFEIFGDDALDVAPKLDLTLTSRERGDKNRIPFCGVPHHSAKGYWLKLLQLGYRVAIVEQMESPEEAKGIVRREVTRVLTPGSLDELEGLASDSPNYLLSVLEDPDTKTFVLVLCDVSTGEFRLGEGRDIDIVRDTVTKYKPREILVRRFFQKSLQEHLERFLFDNTCLFSVMSEFLLRDEEQQKTLLQDTFGKKLPDVKPLKLRGTHRAVIASTLDYFRSLRGSTASFLAIKPLHEETRMIFDETARRDLEIFETIRRRQQKGSLFAEINYTLTPMGARLLRERLGAPFLAKEPIQLSQDQIEAILDLGQGVHSQLREAFQGLCDIERLGSRLLAGTISPTELAKLRLGLSQATAISEWLRVVKLQNHAAFAGVSKELNSALTAFIQVNAFLAEDPGHLGDALTVIRTGFCAEFDALRQMALEGQQEVDRYEEQLKESSGISSLKIKFHKSFGHLVEVTKSNLSKVPKSFIRRQTMVNCERFVTPELQNLGQKLEQAKDQAVAQEVDLYRRCVSGLATLAPILKNVSEAIAEVDVVQGFATLAMMRQLTKPLLSEKGELALDHGRHLVVETFVGVSGFTPNSIRLTGTEKSMLITGPNMAGKSTVMRQVALSALMHQIGSYVPAARASLPIFDRIFTRVGAADDLSTGQSTFMVEMSEASSILRFATARSLVILDEVGRGTSTQDGQAIAAAILEDLTLRAKCYTFFATHYHDLVDLKRKMTSIVLMQTEVREGEHGIIFTHKLIPGAANTSFGIEVAKLAGVPPRVIDRANHYLNQSLSNVARDKAKLKRVPPPLFGEEDSGMEAFPFFGKMGNTTNVSTPETERWVKDITTKLQKMEPMNLTPMDALKVLDDLKKLVPVSFQDQGPAKPLS